MQVRRVRPSEFQRAASVVVAAYEELPGNHMTGGYRSELGDVAARVVGAEVLVAVDPSSRVIGCVTLVTDPASPWAEMLSKDESGIRMLGVDPAVQRSGAGRALVQACIGRSRDLGKAAVFLHSTPWMTAAHRLYEGAGFVRVPERDWNPIPEVPLIAFRLGLR